jgi:LysR family transcriptional regulator, glycine cleavage system transcriptional activator
MPAHHRILPPLDLLKGFEAAARHLSFTRAADELFLTQSAVSRQILALEEFLGVPLFERRHKSLALTEAGALYLRAIGPVLDQVRDATQRVREIRTGHVLTVTTTISFASTWLVPRLSRFRKLEPRIDVRIKATHEVVDLDREGIDLAIRDLPEHAVPKGAVRLMGEHLAAVCSPGYLREARAARRPLAAPADLRHHILLVMHDPQGKWPWISWRAWLEAMGVEELTPTGTLAFDYYDQVINAAMHGQGVALGRMSLAGHYLREKQLVALFGREQKLARAFHVVFAREARERPEVARFLDWLREEIARDVELQV